MKNTILAVLLTLALVSQAQAGGRDGKGNKGNKGGNNKSHINSNKNGSVTNSEQLTEVQKESILFMYQEEKVARDVYITLGEVYPTERTFAFIQKSEQVHVDAVENLCIKYGIDISHVNEDVVGEFVLPELQEMYDTLIVRGQESLLDALYVGEYIEVTDIKDLEEAAVGMPSDVERVFMNLRDGSINHLEAFQNAISREE